MSSLKGKILILLFSKIERGVRNLDCHNNYNFTLSKIVHHWSHSKELNIKHSLHVVVVGLFVLCKNRKQYTGAKAIIPLRCKGKRTLSCLHIFTGSQNTEVCIPFWIRYSILSNLVNTHCFCLPVRIDNDASLVTYCVIIPKPCFRIYRFPNSSQHFQRFTIVPVSFLNRLNTNIKL